MLGFVVYICLTHHHCPVRVCSPLCSQPLCPICPAPSLIDNSQCHRHRIRRRRALHGLRPNQKTVVSRRSGAVTYDITASWYRPRICCIDTFYPSLSDIVIAASEYPVRPARPSLHFLPCTTLHTSCHCGSFRYALGGGEGGGGGVWEGEGGCHSSMKCRTSSSCLPVCLPVGHKLKPSR